MKYLKAIIFYPLIAIIAFAIGFFGTAVVSNLLEETPKTYNVKAEFEPSLAASCAVTGYHIAGFEGGGTGVVLKNGLILTAKHVVDVNENGILDIKEKVVKLKFYYPEEYTMKGVVEYMPPGKMAAGKGMDFALIRPEKPVASNIELASSEYFKNIEVGEEVFTIGRTMTDQLNIAIGYLAPKIPELTCDRITMSGWDGNSGGGIFVRDDSKLIGVFIVARKHPFLGYNIPNWIGYQSAGSIRTYLAENDLEHIIDVKKNRKNKHFYIFLISLLTSSILLMVMHVVILRKRMRQL